MIRSIVPQGFEATAHPIFRAFSPPPVPMVQSRGLSDSISNDLVATEALPAAVQQAPEEPVISCRLVRGQSGLPSESHDLKTSNIAADGAEAGEFTCAICLEEILEPVTLVACQHQYCYQCLYTWYKTRMTCPKCKADARVFVYSGPQDGPSSYIRLWTLAATAEINECAAPLDGANANAYTAEVARSGAGAASVISSQHSSADVKRAMLKHSQLLHPQRALKRPAEEYDNSTNALKANVDEPNKFAEEASSANESTLKSRSLSGNRDRLQKRRRRPDP